MAQETVLKIFAILSLRFAAFARARSAMLMNRNCPSISDLYFANAGGSADRRFLPVRGFVYHTTYSTDGKWIAFSSEKTGSVRLMFMMPSVSDWRSI